jgi:hypothetical protein
VGEADGDTTAGTFSVIQIRRGVLCIAANPPTGPAKWADIGEFAWHELATTDIDAAWAFY